MEEKIKAILDCDPGHDDALAILVASAASRLDLAGITVVAGNQTLDNTVSNALKIVELAEIDTPVYAGYGKPLIRELTTAPEVHGESGLDGPILPDPGTFAADQHAVDFIIDTIRQSEEKITLIPTGPLTNIAAALIGAPDIHNKIEQICFMGGAARGGNWSPAAEFNILVDPEAAAFVMQTDIPKTMIGLDVTRKALLYPEDIEKIKNLGNPVARVAGELLEYYLQYHLEKKKMPGCPLHDPLAVAAVLEPEIISSRPYAVRIETAGKHTTGSTVVDFDGDRFGRPNVEVALEVDRERFVELVLEYLNSYKSHKS